MLLITILLFKFKSAPRWQRDPSVKTLHSPLSPEFWRHCVLSGGTQRRDLPHHQSEEMKI